MPDIDLRDALSQLADEVGVVDLVPQVERRLHARRRSRVIGAGVATLAVTLGAVAAVGATSSGNRRPSRPVSTATPMPSPSATTATRSVFPAWLPPGVTLAGHRNIAPPVRPGSSAAGWKPVPHAWYRIQGQANANTIPPGGVTSANATTTHPATTVDVTFNPNVRKMPLVPTGPGYGDFHRRTISIAGNPALVSVPKSSYGAYRIDWVDAFGYHVVQCDRLKTPEGRSGISIGDMIHMARSLYPQESSAVTNVNVTATFLPEGAKALPAHTPPGGQGTLFPWSLPGPPYGELDVYVQAGDPSNVRAPRPDSNTTVTTVDINGHPGYLTEDTDGYGGVNVVWAQDGYILQARTLRAYPNSGRSAGVSDDVLIRFARGLRITSSPQ